MVTCRGLTRTRCTEQGTCRVRCTCAGLQRRRSGCTTPAQSPPHCKASTQTYYCIQLTEIGMRFTSRCVVPATVFTGHFALLTTGCKVAMHVSVCARKPLLYIVPWVLSVLLKHAMCCVYILCTAVTFCSMRICVVCCQHIPCDLRMHKAQLKHAALHGMYQLCTAHVQFTWYVLTAHHTPCVDTCLVEWVCAVCCYTYCVIWVCAICCYTYCVMWVCAVCCWYIRRSEGRCCVQLVHAMWCGYVLCTIDAVTHTMA